MSRFYKQLLFISLGIAILVVGGVIIYGAIPQGNLKINPILGHDLDLNALYYGQAGNNTVHDITTQDISISAWVKVDVDATAFNRIIAYKMGATAGYKFQTTASLKLGLYIIDATGDSYIVYGNTALNDNKWHYVSAVIDRSDATQSKVFLDGVEDGTTNKAGTLASVDSITNTGTFYFSHPTTATFMHDGQIRDVKLYYAAGDHWSDAQVLYQAQHPFDYSANAGTLTDYWRLDEGSGTTLYGKVNNLTLSNVLAWTTQPKIKMVKQENATTTSNNPVGWWKMDEGTGQYAYDVSGNGNTGTLGTSTVADGADPTWTTGKLGKGLSFDGVNDYVSVAFPMTTTGTLSFWFKSNVLLNSSNPGNYYLLRTTNGSTQTGDFSIYIASSGGTYPGKMSFFQRGSSAWAENNSIQNSWSANTWYHFVGTWDGTNKKLYINSVLNDTDAYTLGSNNRLQYLGSYYTGVAGLNGLIDDVRIYNRALSAGEVGQMYNSTKDGYLGNIKVSTGLVGYWKLDDNNALTSVIDYSGKGNTGTAYSGTAVSTSVLSTSTAMVGRAMSFDGVDDYINCGTGSSLNFGTGNFTISTWMKTSWADANSDKGMFISKYQNSTHEIRFGLTYSNTNKGLRFLLSNGTTNFNIERGAGSANINNGSWHMISMVTNRTNNLVILYLDGLQLGATTDISLLTGSLDNTGIWKFGTWGGIAFYPGLIDEVKIWNRALTATEIQQDYVRGASHLPY